MQLSQTPVVQIHLLTLWNGQLFFVLFCFVHHSIETGGSIKTFMHYWPRGQSVGYVTSPQWVGDTSPRSAWSKRHQKITNKLAYDIRCMCLCTCLFIYALKYGLNIYSFVLMGCIQRHGAYTMETDSIWWLHDTDFLHHSQWRQNVLLNLISSILVHISLVFRYRTSSWELCIVYRV